jgi:hypothetical protein
MIQNVHVKLHPELSLNKAAFNKRKALFTSKLDLNLRKKLLMCYIWNTAFYGAAFRHFERGAEVAGKF